MNLFQHYRDRVLSIIETLKSRQILPSPLDSHKVMVDPPREASHGDLATNAAMVLANQAKMKPRDLADLLAPHLETLEDVEKVEVAGPGFINLTLSNVFWQNQIKDILITGKDYGSSSLGEGHKINVEFVSANPTGPMHTGHARNAVVGDALSSIFKKAGYEVTKEYYINDAGNQIKELARSVYMRYLEAADQPLSESAFGSDMYPGDYLIPIGQSLYNEFGPQWIGKDEGSWIELFQDRAVDAMMEMIKQDLADLGIEMDVYSSEKKLHQNGEIEKALKTLEAMDTIYMGVLEPPKGKQIDDWEARPQLLFKATNYGDDVDRPLKKSDGTWTYFAADIAYHYDKYQRGFLKQIDVLGADHGGYQKRIQAALTALSDHKATLNVFLTQLVNMMENGQPLKMSKRAGTFVKLSDLVERVGKDAVRFSMMTRRHDMTIDFDFAKVVEQSKENPVFYVQYAHARTCSILRHAEELFGPSVRDVSYLASLDLQTINDELELQLVKTLATFPRIIESAASLQEPHRVAFFLQDVASLFHALWNKGKDNSHLRFLDPSDQEGTFIRLALVQAVKTVIACGLDVYGITPIEEMR